jgi:DNA-binding response OmpR family regulator
VDDNRDCAESAALLLRMTGFEARTCYDGRNALLVNDSFRPAVCFLDLNMPGMDGDELARRLRKASQWRPLLLIAVTAMSDEASCTRIKAGGFDLHLVKPVDPGKLVEVADLLFRAAGRPFDCSTPLLARRRPRLPHPGEGGFAWQDVGVDRTTVRMKLR